MNGRSQMQRGKLDFAERDICKSVLLRLSLAGNLDKPLLSLYGTEWKERGYGLSTATIFTREAVMTRGLTLMDSLFTLAGGDGQGPLIF